MIEEKPWQPSSRPKNGDLVLVAVEYVEKELREQVKAAGGRWNPERQLWYAKYGKIAGTALEKHIQVDEFDEQG